MKYYDIPIYKIQECLVTPYENPPWEYSNFTEKDVILYVNNGIFEKKWDYTDNRESNIARIAYFYEFGWNDPIHIDVGIPSLDYYEIKIDDGNHRLYAAILRGDKTILADISGELDYAEELFGIKILGERNETKI